MITAPEVLKSQSMTNNQKHLDKAKLLIKDFEKEMEPDDLHDASVALVNVNLALEQEAIVRDVVRKAALYLWLELLQQLDKYMDPEFNEEEPMSLNVLPPQTTDPQEQAEYKKEVAANQAKLKNQSLQILLERENEQITKKSEAFIRSTYSSNPTDQVELKAAIEKVIENAARKEALNELLSK